MTAREDMLRAYRDAARLQPKSARDWCVFIPLVSTLLRGTHSLRFAGAFTTATREHAAEQLRRIVAEWLSSSGLVTLHV
jgi:hypothetical protein